jgi:alcohol dehydrogenase YqhD (iron-dependent ADH family)
MDDFTFHWKTNIIFGRKTEKQVGTETKKYSGKVLLHYGQKSIKESGLYSTVISSLREAGVDFVELGGVIPNPRIDTVNKGIKLCREHKIEFILAVGGGSVIDSAKAIAIGTNYKGDVWDFFSKKIEITNAIPIGVILTIPAAGSEASPNSVITNHKRKLAVGSDLIRPMFAIMNPELTYSLPKFHSACGISDMLAHIIERYFTNTKFVDFSDKLCEATMRSIIRNAKFVLHDPTNYIYRSEVMWASTIAHVGLLGTGRVEDWASHKIEHELSAYYDIVHGAGLSVIIPAWMKYVYKHDILRFARFGKEVWGIDKESADAALSGIHALEAFYKDIGLPVRLSELKIDDRKLKEMARMCTANGKIGNFVSLGQEDVLHIYKLALK